MAPLARRSEELGYEGVMVADSQNLNADVWVELALAAAATERIRLGPGVTNPATRHPAVTASAAATLQAESGGRAVLGVGRGDSALTQLGREPVHVAELERALGALQGYLSGEGVEFDGKPTRIGWIPDSGQPKVPLAVAATGPHVIEAGARHAEAVDFTVGAEPERLRWAIGAARQAAGGRELSLGAFLNVGVDDDRAAARDLVRGRARRLTDSPTSPAPASTGSGPTTTRLATARPTLRTPVPSRTTSSTASPSSVTPPPWQNGCARSSRSGSTESSWCRARSTSTRR